METPESVNWIREDQIIRLRAKMEDNTFDLQELDGKKVVVLRIPGEEIDLLKSLEYLAEFLTREKLDESEGLLIISDRKHYGSSPEILEPKLEEKAGEDQQLFEELKEKLRDPLKPLVFTTQNDILELFRIGIRINGAMERPETVIGMELMGVELPREGTVVYLIFDDGYRKMTRDAFESLVDASMEDIREGPTLVKDNQTPSASGSKSISSKVKSTSDMLHHGRRSPSHARGWKSPDILLRQFIKDMSEMGYREDSKFSRHDAHQTFLIGLSGPAIFMKIRSAEEDISSFRRILKHRKDALGILMERNWSPRMEAVSRIEGFIYLTGERVSGAHDVIREVIRGGD
jgi:hypothetical protein